MTKAVNVRGRAFLMIDRDTFAVGEYYVIRYGTPDDYFQCVAIQPKIEFIPIKKDDIPEGTNIVELKCDWS